MASSVRFTCTALKNTNKAGILPKDANGYRRITLGALNVFNSAGEYYVYDQARELFEKSSTLMRRVSNGRLRGELGHPIFQPGMKKADYMRRVVNIQEDNVSAHFAEICLDFDNLKDAEGRPIVGIVGLVRGAGPHGLALESSLDNPKESVCFSIRAFTDDKFEGGINRRILREIITWDQVNEPGIASAEKFKSTALESMNEIIIPRADIVKGINDMNFAGLACESAAAISANALLKSMGWEADVKSKHCPDWLKL